MTPTFSFATGNYLPTIAGRVVVFTSKKREGLLQFWGRTTFVGTDMAFTDKSPGRAIVKWVRRSRCRCFQKILFSLRARRLLGLYNFDTKKRLLLQTFCLSLAFRFLKRISHNIRKFFLRLVVLSFGGKLALIYVVAIKKSNSTLFELFTDCNIIFLYQNECVFRAQLRLTANNWVSSKEFEVSATIKKQSTVLMT